MYQHPYECETPFGQNLRRMMQRHGHTIDDIREATGVRSKTTIYKWFRGGGIDDAHLEALARFYSVEPGHLKYGRDEVDDVRLSSIIELVEGHLARHRMDIQPRGKARMISYLYAQDQTTGEPLETSVPRLVEVTAAAV